jgi:hypothetical protein
MSISPVSSVPVAAPSPISAPLQARAADGDYKAANINSSKVKDKDGDYAAASTAAARSSSAVQSSLSALKAGG